jgi:anti-sigma factor RsiW
VPEHLSSEQIERYCKRVMLPSELLVASDHLATCETCRSYFRSSDRLQRAVASLRLDSQAEEPIHLLYEQVAAYVDATLTDGERELIVDHLEACPQCNAEVEGLRAFKAEIKSYPENRPSGPVP